MTVQNLVVIGAVISIVCIYNIFIFVAVFVSETLTRLVVLHFGKRLLCLWHCI